MKIAVISDIHGNMEAVEAVFKDIETRNCEKLFVLGDYAMAGPEPQAVIEYFMNKSKDENVTMIQGNTDLMIVDYNDELYQLLKTKAPIMAEALKSDVQVINQEAKDFLANLPPQKEVVLNGVKFLLVHGSPRRNNEDILPETTMEQLKEMLSDVDAGVVLCGHTHLPCGFQTETKQTVVNTGSIGRPFTPEPKSCYLTITVNEGKCVFEHHFVDYDREMASNKLKKRNFEEAEKLAGMLLNTTERHF